MLQVITTPAPVAPVSRAAHTPVPLETRAAELFDALLARVSRSVRMAAANALTPLSERAQSSDTIDMRALDLRVSNVSVHRVRYVENSGSDSTCSATPQHSSTTSAADTTDASASSDKQCVDSDSDDTDASDWNGSASLTDASDATESFMRRWTRKVQSFHARKRAEVTSVVVTWDDHFRGASAVTADDDSDASASVRPPPTTSSDGPVVTYEVQHWVSSWGLDGLWHPSNRKLSVSDPFVVLANLPQDHEIAFRVRMRVQKTAGLLSTGWFAAETEGPWSAVVRLSPSRDAALAAIAAFLLSNKAFSVVLLLIIGIGSLVVCRLFVSHRFHTSAALSATGSLSTSSSAVVTTVSPPLSAPTTDVDSETTASDSDTMHWTPRMRPRSTTRRNRSAVSSSSAPSELVQEIQHLRQELADSEAEVRKLMLFRGYGVEQLSPQELAGVEHELRATLQQIQRLRQSPQHKQSHHHHHRHTIATSSEDETEGDDTSDAQSQRLRTGSRASGRGRGGSRRHLAAVFESADDTS